MLLLSSRPNPRPESWRRRRSAKSKQRSAVVRGEARMSWSRDRQKIRTTYNYATKRLVQLELGGDKRLRFSVETYADESAAIKADDRLEVTWKDDWQKPRKLNHK